VDTTLSAFSTAVKSWSNSTTNAQAESDAEPAIAALESLTTTLTNDKWPTDATADVHALIGDIGAITGDLQGLSTVNLLNASTWEQTFLRDLASGKSAVALVRSDLGLPPAPSS
jgi:hypothetical protein